jgi:alkylhydroperoxidase family enzyme
MARLSPPGRGPELEHLFRFAEETWGYVPNGLATMGHRPELLAAFTIFSAGALGDPPLVSRRRLITLTLRSLWWSVWRRRGPAPLPVQTRMLVAAAASEATGSRYCEAHAAVSAAAAGVPLDKIEAGRFFRSSSRYSDAERAAMRFAQAAATVPNRVTGAHFDELRRHYTEPQIVDILATVSLYGFLNRWNNALATDLEPQAHRFARDHLQPTGWQPGGHGTNDSRSPGATGDRTLP